MVTIVFHDNDSNNSLFRSYLAKSYSSFKIQLCKVFFHCHPTPYRVGPSLLSVPLIVGAIPLLKESPEFLAMNSRLCLTKLLVRAPKGIPPISSELPASGVPAPALPTLAWPQAACVFVKGWDDE